MYALQYKHSSARPFIRLRRRKKAKAVAKKVAERMHRAVCIYEEKKDRLGDKYLKRIGCVKGRR